MYINECEVDKAEAGDETIVNEIEKLYEEYKPLVYHYLYSVCGDSLLAEEITQETFFRIISRCFSASQFIPERIFKKGMPIEIQIYHLAYQLLRKELLRKDKEQADEFVCLMCAEIPTADYLPEVSAMYHAELDEVYEKMKSLKEPVRNVMFLRYYRKRTYKEIAACLEQSENWVKHIISKGKEQLGQMLCHDVSL